MGRSEEVGPPEGRPPESAPNRLPCRPSFRRVTPTAELTSVREEPCPFVRQRSSFFRCSKVIRYYITHQLYTWRHLFLQGSMVQV